MGCCYWQLQYRRMRARQRSPRWRCAGAGGAAVSRASARPRDRCPTVCTRCRGCRVRCAARSALPAVSTVAARQRPRECSASWGLSWIDMIRYIVTWAKCIKIKTRKKKGRYLLKLLDMALHSETLWAVTWRSKQSVFDGVVRCLKRAPGVASRWARERSNLILQ